MALDITLEATAVSEPRTGKMLVTVNMVAMDGLDEVINHDFVGDKRPAIQWSAVGEELRTEMQEVIEKYKREQNVLAAPALISAVETLEGQLVG